MTSKICGLAIGFATALAPVGTAAQDAPSDAWQWTGSLYLWGAGIDGTTRFGSDVSVSFGDILDNLDFGVLASLEAQRGKWFVLGDIVYLDVSAGQASSRPVLPGLPGGGVTIDSTAAVGVKGTVFNLVGGYELVQDRNLTLHGVFGARYLSLDATVNLAITTGGLGRSVNVNRSENKLDAVVGLRGRARIDDRWFVPFYLDVGTGQSDFTWQAFAGIGYNFGRSDLVFGYRHIGWEFDGSGLLTDIAFSGPGLKYSYRF